MEVLITLLSSIVRAASEQFITDAEALKWIRLALSVVDSGVELDTKFKALQERLQTRLDAAEHFGEADFDAIVAEVKGRDERWANV